VPRYHRKRVFLRHILLLISIPLILTSGSYALFTQNLSIDATQGAPLYVSSQYLLLTYTKTLTVVGGVQRYSIGFTIKNNGPVGVTAWRIKFDLPSDFTNFACASSSTCSRVGLTETIVNGGKNGTIAVGGTRSLTISFRTALTDYTLQNVYISGTYAAGYQTITGLTVGVAQGTRTFINPYYRWPVTFTVTNNSGFTLSAWQITVPWTTARTVISMPSGVTYTTNATQLLINSTVPITNGSTYVFTPTLGSTGSTWTVTATIKGQP